MDLMSLEEIINLIGVAGIFAIMSYTNISNGNDGTVYELDGVYVRDNHIELNIVEAFE